MSEFVHVATLGKEKVFLRKNDAKKYQWFKDNQPTNIEAENPGEAIRLARKEWNNFNLIPCGYVFTLPERDEHGNNALFSQMIKSINSLTGVYFDEDLGHNCIVKEIPIEARRLYEHLKSIPGAL